MVTHAEHLLCARLCAGALHVSCHLILPTSCTTGAIDNLHLRKLRLREMQTCVDSYQPVLTSRCLPQTPNPSYFPSIH